MAVRASRRSQSTELTFLDVKKGGQLLEAKDVYCTYCKSILNDDMVYKCITSQIAGVLWEYPPAICGQHTDVGSLALSKGWSVTSYHIFNQLSKSLPAIKMRTTNFFFEDLPDQLNKMREIEASCVQGFVRDPDLIAKHTLPSSTQMHTWRVWLHDLVEAKGMELITHHVEGDLLDSEAKLLETYGAIAIVNATSLNSFEAAGDKSCYPLRGGLIRLVNNRKWFPKVMEALDVTHDNELIAEHKVIIFIVPRNDNWMCERCNKFVLGLENAEFDPVAPVVQGLRLTHVRNVHVGRELRPSRMHGESGSIVHSYGQGGSSFSFSVGMDTDRRFDPDEFLADADFNVKADMDSYNPPDQNPEYEMIDDGVAAKQKFMVDVEVLDKPLPEPNADSKCSQKPWEANSQSL
ncbi:nucleotide-binding domain-containing protein [Armillaria luteobubalina]|uniref:Nucleotide-binding domain-containing protein n=1 Tax=Armillaria luteobubalina TaxID=153913 RepID=A0AA39U123_9AGAR|nr:nucleotide-binding domain-containing protein [Armillaria luteobubalina]